MFLSRSFVAVCLRQSNGQFQVCREQLGTALSRPAVPAVCLRAWGGALIPLLHFLRKIQLN